MADGLLVGSQALRADHGAVDVAVDFLRLVAVIPRLRHLQFEFADGRSEFGVFLQLALLLGRLLLFADRTFARGRNFARGRQARFGEALLLRQIFVFDQRLVVVLA